MTMGERLVVVSQRGSLVAAEWGDNQDSDDVRRSQVLVKLTAGEIMT